ncbi:MAG: efflux RND transporter periplasmic adaptor subunit, partial [Bacteroidaceae bacterium]|nr:efflux RND transporter periplasmic adaptor subunit [Bacteroidaceae bacterium]
MKRIAYIAILMLTASCGKQTTFDAQGTFEATEIVVSSEATGKILHFEAEEGTLVEAGQQVGAMDSLQLHLQRKQLIAQQSALLNSRPDIKKQMSSLREQIAKQKSELQRVENMLRDGAATQKQHDDINAHIRVLEGQLEATLSTLGKNTASINDNSASLEAQIAALDDRIAKCHIIAPTNGTVLVKYAEAGELGTVGKPLMKIANLEKIYLRAYFTSDQLANIRLGDTVKVIADFGGDEQHE